MKSLHYAFADLYYYKKFTIVTTIIFSVFLLIINTVLNLIDLNKYWINKLVASGSNDSALLSYQSWNSIYSSMYIGSIILFGLFISIGFFVEGNKRKALVQKWRLLGFSKVYILKQVLLEVLIITLAATLIVSSFLVIFQNMYESALFHIHSFAEVEHPMATSSIIIAENLPTSTTDSVYQASGLFSFDIQRLSLVDIFGKFNRNSAVLIGISLCVSAFFTGCALCKSKVSFRK